ncbi:MAG TPA: MXAN_5187 C-terminal domain-containing protein [Thermoanaerobaculia bacterium]|nr:MXAN_5187 C-terminal domain-containing protein [Thermoanaerobaculia bacterium]
MIKQDEELDRLEEDIRRLKSRYDQFFNGITKLPPSFERHQLESMIHEISKQKMRDNGRRFRFNTVLSRYNQYREMWGRKMREREEGPLDFRRRQALMEAAPAPPPEPAAHIPVTSARPDPYVKMSPGANGEEIRRLYGEIERAHFDMGTLPNISLEQVTAMIEKQSNIVREKYNVKTVAFRVETVDGKVKLRAKPLQD